jgi:NAD(P)H-dependent FMN reductase
MKTVIISGSHRADSQSMRVAQFTKKRIVHLGGEASIIDLSHNALPLWDEGMWSGDQKWKSIWAPIAEKLRGADSLVLVTPEYAGMASPALKNFFLFLGGDLVAHKPAAIISVTTSAFSGSYPVQELRGSSFKNCRLVYIPDHVIVRTADKLLVGDQVEPNSADFFTRQRIDYSIVMLKEYAQALAPIQKSQHLNYKEMPFGM